MHKLSVLAFVIFLSTAAVSAQDTQTITLESDETQSIDVAGSHEVTLRYVDGGAALSIDGTDSVYYDGSFGDSGDKFIVNGLVVEIEDYGYSPGYADISFSSLDDTLTLYDRETVQFEQNDEVNMLKLNYVDGGASVTLNGEETPLGEELQTGDTFSAGGATIEVEQTGYEGQDGFMEFKIEGMSGGASEIPEQVSVGESFTVRNVVNTGSDQTISEDNPVEINFGAENSNTLHIGDILDDSVMISEGVEPRAGRDEFILVSEQEGHSEETLEFRTGSFRIVLEDASLRRNDEIGLVEEVSLRIEENSEDPEEKYVNTEETFEVAAGDTVRFGPDDVNSFEVVSVNSDLVNIVPESDKADTGITERVGIVDFMDLEFESGLYRASVVERGSDRATMKLVRSYSSDFSCGDYQTGENEYKFCTNQGDGAVKEVDLGYDRSVDLNFVNNYYINNEKHTTLSGPERALTITHGEGLEYRGAEINVNEFRGLQRDEDYEAIIQVEIPEREPEASLEFVETGYTSGDQASLTAIAEQEGLYRIEIEGPGVDQETDIESGDSTIEVQPNGAGTLEARAIAPGTWWNPLDNDRIVAKASAEVRESVEGENHRFGEKFTIQEEETTQIEGHDFYLSTLVGTDEDGYVSVLWRESEGGDTNSGIVLLKQVANMGFRYEDSFRAYGTVCSINPEAETAEIVVKQERFNPWDVCNRNPSEFRGEEQRDYEIKDYELGEKVTLEEGEALEFGESRAYFREIERYEDVFLSDGHLEWIGESSYWNPPTEGSSTINYFYEGEIATGTCETSESQVTLVMEESDEIQGEWPEDWCSEDESYNYQVELGCETPVESGERTQCYVDRFDSRLGEISDYSWDKSGPGQLDLEAQSVEHTVFYAPEDVSETETATIHYSVTDEQGNTAYGSTDIEVSAERRNIQPEISVSSEEIEVFEGVDLTAYPEGDYTYRWDLNSDNQYERDGRTVSHEWSKPGTKNIRLKVETGTGEFTRERSLRVTGRDVEVIKSCGFIRDDYDAAGIEAEGPRLTATLEDSVDTSHNEFDLFWRVNGQDIGERGGVAPGTGLPAVDPNLDQLDPGRYNLNVLARAGGNYLDNESCGSLTVREESDLAPEIGLDPENPEVLEAVNLEAEPAGDYSYTWDLDNDGEYERTGREITTEYELPGSKNVGLRILTDNNQFETERSINIENPEVSSSLQVSKEEVTKLEPIQISYRVGEAIAKNGYRLQVDSPSGEKVFEVTESSKSGSRDFVPSRDAETGRYTARLIASEGFLSSILRVVFGPEAEKEFEVVDVAGELDRWRNYCQENGFDPLTASGRISCVKQLVGPECFKENPGQECKEIAESTCEYYVGTGVNPEEGRCRE